MGPQPARAKASSTLARPGGLTAAVRAGAPGEVMAATARRPIAWPRGRSALGTLRCAAVNDPRPRSGANRAVSCLLSPLDSVAIERCQAPFSQVQVISFALWGSLQRPGPVMAEAADTTCPTSARVHLVCRSMTPSPGPFPAGAILLQTPAQPGCPRLDNLDAAIRQRR